MDVNALKEAIKCCAENNCFCCPRNKNLGCICDTMHDAENYITELEERIAIMQESMETLEKRCNALNALEQRCKALDEPLAPEIETQNDIDVLYRCPTCHKYLFYRFQKHCCICGQAVKWE